MSVNLKGKWTIAVNTGYHPSGGTFSPWEDSCGAVETVL
jgi:hypothetical protein